MDEHNYAYDESDEIQLSEDEEKLLDDLGLTGSSRREFLGRTLGGAIGIFALQLLAKEKAMAGLTPASNAVFAPSAELENAVKVVFKVNGVETSLNVDSRMALLDALRERLSLTGTKKGCDQ